MSPVPSNVTSDQFTARLTPIIHAPVGGLSTGIPARREAAVGMPAIHRTLDLIVDNPHVSDLLDLCMCAVLDAKIQDGTEPDWMGFIGAPGGGKTEAIMACKGIATVSVDELASAASFLSGARSPDGKGAIPLLEEWNAKAVLCKDMTAMLTDDPKKAKAILGKLTNAYDGEFAKGIGTAFEGSAMKSVTSRFSLVFAVTVEVWLQHSQIVSATGARSLMYLIPRPPAGPVDFQRARNPRKKEHRALLAAQVQARLAAVIQQRLPVTIPRRIERWLEVAAQFIAKGRTPMRSERLVMDDRVTYSTYPGTEEAPYRCYQQLRGKLINLCRIYGHSRPTPVELRILRHVVWSSIALDRAQILVETYPMDTFTLVDAMTLGGLKEDAAKYRLQALETLGMIHGERQKGQATVYKLAEFYQSLRALPDGLAQRSKRADP